MPKQHNALYGDDLHNPKGMTVDSHASSSKFIISASNMTITASGYTVKAAAFQGDGSGLTGVPANDWDGTHSGNGVITGNLEIQGNTSGSITSTGSFGKVEATKLSGDGSGITGVTAEWDGSHTGTATFAGNVTASGVVSASGGFVGDGSNLSGIAGGIFVATGSIQAYTGDAHITGSVKIGDPGASTVNDAGDHVVNYSTYTFYEPQLPAGDGDYTHALSTGNRSGSISYAGSSGVSTATYHGWNGNTNGGNYGFRQRWDGTQVGNYVTIDLKASYYVSEIRQHEDGNGSTGGVSNGDWKWQGSNDNSTWTDIGPSQNVTSSYSNQTGITTAITSPGTYRYYKWIATAAGTSYSSGTHAIYEWEFKIKGADPVSTKVLDITDGGSVSGSSVSTGSFGRLNIDGAILDDGNISGSSTSTGSFGKVLGDGSSLTSLPDPTTLTSVGDVTQLDNPNVASASRFSSNSAAYFNKTYNSNSALVVGKGGANQFGWPTSSAHYPNQATGFTKDNLSAGDLFTLRVDSVGGSSYITVDNVTYDLKILSVHSSLHNDSWGHWYSASFDTTYGDAAAVMALDGTVGGGNVSTNPSGYELKAEQTKLAIADRNFLTYNTSSAAWEPQANISGSSTSTGSFGTLRLDYDNLPTSNPTVKGAVWRDGTDLKISGG
jgi:hypothetical protein